MLPTDTYAIVKSQLFFSNSSLIFQINYNIIERQQNYEDIIIIKKKDYLFGGFSPALIL